MVITTVFRGEVPIPALKLLKGFIYAPELSLGIRKVGTVGYFSERSGLNAFFLFLPFEKEQATHYTRFLAYIPYATFVSPRKGGYGRGKGATFNISALTNNMQ